MTPFLVSLKVSSVIVHIRRLRVSNKVQVQFFSIVLYLIGLQYLKLFFTELL